MSIKREDTVIVIAGKDKGKKGKVRQVFPSKGRLIVEGAYVVKRHTKPRGQARQAGIIEREAAIDISNVMLVCPKCSQPTRIRSKKLGDGKRVRECVRCQEVVD